MLSHALRYIRIIIAERAPETSQFWKSRSAPGIVAAKLGAVGQPSASGVTLAVPSTDLGDHYTFRTTHYIPLSGRLIRVYAYDRGRAGVRIPST